ncbi:MAG: hypothetical protein JSU66_11695 [Deltaproteobacteria bacterium]|nr:MAG: hypothetical protein JSU66_11695 [Deltaproteobacteria bacterium]
MSESAGIVQGSIDRFQAAVESIEGDVRKFQKNLRSQRKDLEKRFERTRKNLEKQTRQRVDRALSDVRKRPAYKRVESARKDLSKRVDAGVETFLGAFGVASRSEVQRLDRKLNQVNKKLRELEKGPGAA